MDKVVVKNRVLGLKLLLIGIIGELLFGYILTNYNTILNYFNITLSTNVWFILLYIIGGLALLFLLMMRTGIYMAIGV